MKLIAKTTITAMLLASPLAMHAQIIYIKDAGQQRSMTEMVKPSSQLPTMSLRRIPVSNITLSKSLFSERYALNKAYVMRLDSKKLLQNFYYEAGLTKRSSCILVGKEEQGFESCHWGWESPMCELRGHFLGHWLSAAAYMYAETHDAAVKQKADGIVDELAICQEANGDGWAGSIPEKYLTVLLENGREIWSPQYTLHKTLMGLYDMYHMTGSTKALEVADKFAAWFHRWTGDLISKGKANVIYSGETAGMLEIWANLYEATKNAPQLNLDSQKYLDLMERYGNPYIFQQLANGEDALSLNHANASIPWSQGAARCYEVTGNTYWKNLVEAFWKCAVDNRDTYATGGQGAGEHWIPNGQLATFAGENNQEHCAVYNMMRTADYLYRWTGDQKYADYYERNLYNGILAQQNPNTGMVAYFLPMGPGYKKGGEKGWGSETQDFFCCHGSLVQAQVRYLEDIYFENDRGLMISQYVPSTLKWQKDGKDVTVTQDFTADQWNNEYDAPRWKMEMHVKAAAPVTFDLQLRLPWWLAQKAQVTVNGNSIAVQNLHGTLTISREWNADDKIMVIFPDRLWTEQLKGSKNQYALLEGPIVLAGITDGETPLKGDIAKPENMLIREHNQQYRTVRWTQSHYRTTGQQHNIRFVPLYEIADETYSIYFPINK